MTFYIAVFYSPWVIRNLETFEKVILTKTPFWQNIYLGFTPEVNIWKDVVLISENHERFTFKLRYSIDEFKMEEIYKQETLRVINGDEGKLFKKGLQNAILLWYVPSRYIHDDSLAILFGRKIFVILLNILTILGLIFLHRKNKICFLAFIIIFVGFTVPYMIGHAANTRFKLDFEWLQYILIAILIGDFLQKRKLIETTQKSAERFPEILAV